MFGVTGRNNLCRLRRRARAARSKQSRTRSRNLHPSTAPGPIRHAQLRDGLRTVSLSRRSELGRLTVHASSCTAACEEDLVAELLLGNEVLADDRLVVQRPCLAICRTEDVGAVVAVLVAAGVTPAGLAVRVGNRFVDLVARGADLGV